MDILGSINYDGDQLQVLFYTAGGHCQRTFYPFCGVNEELKSFIHDISQANRKVRQS